MTPAQSIRGCGATHGEYRACLRRAQAYRRWDQRLRGRTRFFAAAAVVSEVLALLCDTPLRFAVSAAARRFLASLNADLELVNARSADRIESGALHSTELDAHLVRLEQAFVQTELNLLLRTRGEAAHALLGDCNRLLNAGGLWLGCSQTPHILRCALVDLRHSRRAALDFGRQSDREQIGNGLIAAIRRGSA
jgi:hypothetical protein